MTTVRDDEAVAASEAAGRPAALHPPELPVPLAAGETVDSVTRNAKPGIALCLSGGGYRAMVFHIGALWRLNEAGLLRRLSLVSSVSGGSITAGVLGHRWNQLRFDGNGVVQNLNIVFDALRNLARRTIDAGSIVSGFLLPGSTIGDRVAAAYDKHLFQGATLQHLPDEGGSTGGPRFLLNSTSVQTGSLWRFCKAFMGDWQVGLIRKPDLPLARAVAASSAFPPVLSPVTLDVDPRQFDPATAGPLCKAPYNDEVVLSDGGVYDNMGLETAFKAYQTLLVSDAGQKMSPEGSPEADWARHSLRVMGLLDNQVRNLRKRQLIDAFKAKVRTGAYWSARTQFKDYGVSDPLGVGGDRDPDDPKRTQALAATPTRLEAMPDVLQEKLINWGYAVCDAALRAHCKGDFKQLYNVDINDPAGGVPYPGAWL